MKYNSFAFNITQTHTLAPRIILIVLVVTILIDLVGSGLVCSLVSMYPSVPLLQHNKKATEARIIYKEKKRERKTGRLGM